MKYDIISDDIIQWLNGYARQSKTNGFVVGISGGIDSALTSTLCAKTGLPTICVDMPILQNKNEVNRSSNHIKWLQNKFDNVNTIEKDQEVEEEMNLSPTLNTEIGQLLQNSMDISIHLSKERENVEPVPLPRVRNKKEKDKKDESQGKIGIEEHEQCHHQVQQYIEPLYHQLIIN